MADIRPARLNYLRDSEFTITLDGGAVGNDYAGSCSSVRAEPGGSTSTFYGMKPRAVYSERGDWQLAIAFADDYDAADSLWSFLYDHEGEQATIEFRPRADGVGFSVDATLLSGGIGGETRNVATSTVTLECSRPERLADETPEV